MEKKIYVKPTVCVEEFQQENPFLAGSEVTDIDSNIDIEYVGGGIVPAQSRDLN